VRYGRLASGSVGLKVPACHGWKPASRHTVAM
jgi:hypothetical protein